MQQVDEEMVSWINVAVGNIRTIERDLGGDLTHDDLRRARLTMQMIVDSGEALLETKAPLTIERYIRETLAIHDELQPENNYVQISVDTIRRILKEPS